MGRLILGILFVILLQVVFFGYTSRYWSNSDEVAVAPPVAAPILPAETPELPSLQTQSIPPTQAESIRRSEGHAEDLAVRKSPRPIVTRPRVTPTVAKRATPRYSSLRRIHTTPWKTTVIKVRNESESERIAAVAPRNPVTSAEYAFVAQDRKQAQEGPRRKKRSIIGKTYSLVVKKPWGWMKAIAAKLD